MNSIGVRTAINNIKSVCGSRSSGLINISTPAAALGLAYDINHSPVGAQVGAWDGTWKISSGTLWLAIHNEAGEKSFYLHMVENKGRQWGPGRTIFQDFTIGLPNPCGTP